MRGGLLNTDAVDNSGGVDMSDHEVNIKILLDLLVRQGVIKSRADRNQILAEMTDEVSELVLADNENQARALTLDGLRSAARYDEFVGIVEQMVTSGIINRSDAAIPAREQLLASPARSRGLPRPVLASVLAYAKNWSFTQVLRAPLVDSPTAEPFLVSYFPARLQQNFQPYFTQHPLRREIIATAAVNYLMNHAGISLLPRVITATRRDAGAVVTAYLDVDREAGAAAQRARILSSGHDVHREHELLLDLEETLEASTRAALERRKRHQPVREDRRKTDERRS